MIMSSLEASRICMVCHTGEPDATPFINVRDIYMDRGGISLMLRRRNMTDTHLWNKPDRYLLPGVD